MNFDLDNLDAGKDTTFRLVIGYNPAVTEGGKPEEVGFVVVGMASDQYAAAARAASVRGIQEAHKRFAANEEPPKPGTPEAAEAQFVRTEAQARLVADHCVVGWFGWRQGDKEAPFSAGALKHVLDKRPGLVARITRAVEDDANFVTG